MLSLFPALYNYANLVPTILRLFLGYFFLKIAIENYLLIRQSDSGALKIALLSILPGLGGLLILAGFLFQPTAIFLAMILIILIISGKNIELKENKNSRDFYIISALVLLSLALLGPGLLAIDLPL